MTDADVDVTIWIIGAVRVESQPHLPSFAVTHHPAWLRSCSPSRETITTNRAYLLGDPSLYRNDYVGLSRARQRGELHLDSASIGSTRTRTPAAQRDKVPGKALHHVKRALVQPRTERIAQDPQPIVHRGGGLPAIALIRRVPWP